MESGPAPPTDSKPLQPGAEPIPGYRLVQRLGAGGFGEVWKAQAPGGFDIALKFVGNTAGKSSKRPPGESELRALDIIKNIHHPNLLTTFGAWQTPGHLVIAMELADGSLWDRFCEFQERGLPGIPRAELLDYFEEAAKGIDYLNTAKLHLPDGDAIGVQHRDIKPQNILLLGGGVKVADFGLARLLERSMTGHTGSMTVSYAPPEFFQGHTSRHSDQYSLGISYCQMRGGRLPYEGSMAQVTAGHLMREPDLTMLADEERPIVAGALAKNPQERWPTCREFIQALRAIRLPGDTPSSGTLSLPPSHNTYLSSRPTTSVGITLPAAAAEPPPRAGGKGKHTIVLGLVLLTAIGLLAWRVTRPPGGKVETPHRPTFGTISLEVPAEVSLRAGETRQINLKVVRQNVSVPIIVKAEQLPAGVTLEEKTVPGDIAEVAIVFTASAETSEGVHDIRLLGNLNETTVDSKPLQLRVLPKLSTHHLRAAESLRTKRDFDGAITEATEAIRHDPKAHEAFFCRAFSYSEKGDLDKSLADYFEVLRLNPKNVAALHNRGIIWSRKGDLDRAIADFNEAIRLRPSYASAYNSRGYTYLLKKDYERCIADCTEALRHDPKSERAFANRGQGYLGRGEYDHAIADFTNAIELKPSVYGHYSMRATAYEKKGDLPRAAADRRTAASLK